MKINKQLSYSLIYNIVNALFPLITLPIVFRALSPDIYGGVVFSNIIYQSLFALFFTSLTSYSIREYKRDKISTTIEIYSLQLVFSIIAITIYIILSQVIELVFGKENNYLIIFCISLLFCAFYSDWVMYSEQDYKKLFFRTIIVKGFLLILIFLLVKDNSDVYIYTSLLCLSYISNNLISLYCSVVTFSNKYKIKLSLFYSSVCKAKYFIGSSSVGLTYQYLDQILIGIFLNNTSLAYLNILKQIVAMLGMITSTFCRFLQPQASLAYLKAVEIKKYHKVNALKYFIVLCLISLFILTFGEYGLELFVGNKFTINYISVVICCLLFIISSISAYIDTQHSVPSGLEKVTLYGNLVVMFSYFPLIYLLAPIYNYNGVLLGLFFAELLSVIFILNFHYKKRKLWLK
ncbi:oligosaccharide flippase family protein [Photobacterium leiognathi]|uniref:oligosaccharide flippase family protein n=1 Tax=Photobacterium leiognathi TaxID=553611 RepID=UPI00298238F8|nr:oligosaccharide flippase family protein [Photobacterium leiognathi]